ncbi:MAG: Hint domain-containing protein [Pseudomonadota bacterium]
MAFKDVINDYSNGATGKITTLSGDEVAYKVSGNSSTVNWGSFSKNSAKVNGNGSNEVTVTFEEPVVGASVTLTGSDGNEKYLIEVDGEIVDLNKMIHNGDATLSNVGSKASHKINEDGSISGENYWDGSVGQVTFHVPVTSIGVTGSETKGWDSVEVGIEDSSFDTICFAGETLLRTELGLKSAARIEADDKLWTLDAGFQPVRWVGRRVISAAQLAAYPKLRPIRIARDALGKASPNRTLRVSRQHRIFVTSAIVDRVHETPRALVPAFRLCDLPEVTRDDTLKDITYVHVLFDTHHVLEANGALAESLCPGAMARRALTPNARLQAPASLLQDVSMACAYSVPQGSKQKAIIRRHLKNAMPLQEIEHG